MTLSHAIERRLCVPSTPTELAALMEAPVRTVRATLYQLRKQSRVERLDRTLPRYGRVGRREHLWARKYLETLL